MGQLHYSLFYPFQPPLRSSYTWNVPQNLLMTVSGIGRKLQKSRLMESWSLSSTTATHNFAVIYFAKSFTRIAVDFNLFHLKIVLWQIKKHFFTSNAYQCLELNAHSLVLTELRLQESQMTELFLPWCFGSQQCESYYKALRLFTPVVSTQTNFTVGEVITSRGWRVKTGKNILFY